MEKRIKQQLLIRNILAGATALLLATPMCAQQTTTTTDTIANPDGSYTIHSQTITRTTSAQNTERHSTANALLANWFVSAQAGATMYMGAEDNKGDFGKRITPLYEISVGKWIYPYLGARLSFGQGSLTGFSTKQYEQIGPGYCQEPPVTDPNAAGEGGLWKQHWQYRSVHIDLLYDLGSKRNFDPSRFYHCRAAVGIGANWDYKDKYKNDRNRIAAFYIGLNHAFRINHLLQLECDTRYVVTNETFDRERTHGGVPGYANVSVGLTWNINAKKRDSKNASWHYSQESTHYADVRDSYTEQRTYGEHTVQKGETRISPAVVYFNCDKYDLLPEYQLTLQLVAKQMKESGLNLMLVGSADSATSTPDHNQWLSEQRCQAVKDYLVNKCDIPAERLEMKPMGGTDSFSPFRLNRAVFICTERDQNALNEVEAITKQSNHENR